MCWNFILDIKTGFIRWINFYSIDLKQLKKYFDSFLFLNTKKKKMNVSDFSNESQKYVSIWLCKQIKGLNSV